MTHRARTAAIDLGTLAQGKGGGLALLRGGSPGRGRADGTTASLKDS